MKILLYIFAFLLCFRFLGIFEVPSTTFAVVLLLMGLCNYKAKLPFNKTIILIGVFLCLNFLSCRFFRGQNVLDTFRASNEFCSLALYWFFYSWKRDIDQWEKILWWLCLVFGICYLIQYIAFPVVIFGGQIRTESEEQRMAIIGQGLASFSVLFGLNKYLVTHKYKYIIIILLGLFAVFGCGYRTMLLALIISIFVLFLRMGISVKSLFTMCLLMVLLLLFVSNVPFVQDQINNMIERQNTLNDVGIKDDIRYVNLIYHYTSYFKHPVELLLGSGMPFPTTNYGLYSSSLLEQYHFYYSDLGLIGLSWMIGIPAVVVMIIYAIRIFLIRVPIAYLYIGIYFFNITISSITTHEFYIHSNYVVQAILFCVFTKVLEKYDISFNLLKGKYS